MKVVVDTNVLAYYLLGTRPFHRDVSAFLRSCSELCAPASWEAELASVIWMAVRKEVVSLEQAVTKLEWAARLGVESVDVRSLWQGALARSVRSDISTYDTLFVELAAREGRPLATYDSGILRAFPELAVRPVDLLESPPGR